MCLARYVECITAANVCSISQLVLNTQSTVLVTVLITDATFLVASKQKEKNGPWAVLWSWHGTACMHVPIQLTSHQHLVADQYDHRRDPWLYKLWTQGQNHISFVMAMTTDSVQIQAFSYFLTENELLAQTTEAYTSTYGSAEFTVFLLPFHLGKHWQMVSFLNFISVFTPDGE